MVEVFVFAVAALVILGGALGVVLNANPVHAALSLVATLFGVAVLFVAQQANFLAAVQVIVYAGAIVVLFLFVIMLLGVDRSEDLTTEPLVGQRPVAVVVGGLLGAGLVAVVVTSTITGLPSASAEWERSAEDFGGNDISQIGRLLFSDQLFAFEITSLLLVIAVVGAVVLARTAKGDQVDEDEPVASLPGDPVDDDEDADAEASA